MKKILFLLCFLMFNMCPMLAQVNESIAVQVMVVQPENQEIRANEDVTIKLQLRHNGEDGDVLTEQTFPVKTDNMGICTLMFDVSDKINWGDGSYFIATFIDGEETSVSKLSSVPYALGAKKAETAETAQVAQQLNGVITSKDLVGKWVDINGKIDDAEGHTTTCIFNEDGTAVVEQTYKHHSDILKGTWVLSSNASLLIDGRQTDEGVSEVYPHFECTPTQYHNGILYLNLYGDGYAFKKVL